MYPNKAPVYHKIIPVQKQQKDLWGLLYWHVNILWQYLVNHMADEREKKKCKTQMFSVYFAISMLGGSDLHINFDGVFFSDIIPLIWLVNSFGSKENTSNTL